MNMRLAGLIALGLVIGLPGCATTSSGRVPIEERTPRPAPVKPVPSKPIPPKPAASESGIKVYPLNEPQVSPPTPLTPAPDSSALALPPASGSAPNLTTPPIPAPHVDPAIGELFKQADRQASERNFPQAIATLERGLQIAPNEPWLWHRLARLHFAQGELQQARTFVDRSKALAKNNPEVMSANLRLMAEIDQALGKAAAAGRVP